MLVEKLKKMLDESSYDVVITNKLTGCGRGHDRYTQGMILPDQMRILIKDGLSPEERTKTLIHELIHESHPDWDEEAVEKNTQTLFESLNDEDKGYFMFYAQEAAHTQTNLTWQPSLWFTPEN